MKRVLGAFLFCLAATLSLQAQIPSAVPPLETILARMAQARVENRIRLRPYQVTRDYNLFGKEKTTSKSEVIADVTFVPPDRKHYIIKRAKGMGLGEKIVRQMLDHETDFVQDYRSTEISTANYDFRFLTEETLNGRRCYVLELQPRRKDKNLLKGRTWVDAQTFQVHRTEGNPAKAPSWWLREVHIALVYGAVGEMWLQTGSHSTAAVRLLGQYTMVARDVDYKLSETAAVR